MAANEKNYCRIKLFVMGTNASQTRALWHTVNFHECVDVSSVVINLKKMLNLSQSNVDLYMQNVIIPEWENCARVFRDNDDIELRYRPSAIQESCSSSLKYTQDHQSSLLEINDGGTPISICEMDNIKKRKRKSRTKSEKHVKKTKMVAEKTEEEESPIGHLEKAAGHAPNSPLSLAAVESKNGFSEVTKTELREGDKSDGDLSESSDEDRPSVRRKANRSAQLTPIEQQLIDELQSLPKVKRKRKHKRKKSQKVVEPTAANAEVVNPSPVKLHSLNSSHSGVKKVFDSPDEKEDQVESLQNELSVNLVGVNGSQWASKSQEMICQPSGDFRMSAVSSLPVNGDVVMVTDTPNISSVEVTPKPQLLLPTAVKVNQSVSPKMAKASGTTQAVQRSYKPGQPVVYKREKLKLRATLSPAIIDQLSTTGSEPSAAAGLTAASPLPSSSSKKGIKWHQTKVNSSTPKQRLAKDTVMADEQANVSSIHECDSRPSKEPPVSATKPLGCKDYSLYPDLVGAPRTGDLIAFKRLEMSSNYTPEPSGYKEGTVVNYEPQSTLLQVRLINKPAEKREIKRGVFDIHIEGEQETFTNVTVEGNEIVDVLSNFLEPKLMKG